MTLKDRIIRYILKRSTTTLLDLEGVVVKRGYTLDELYATLDDVHRDKRIQYSANASGGIVYRPAVTRTPSTPTHLEWLRGTDESGKPNYPPMTKENDGSGIDIDLSWMFLKPAEMDEYRAMMKGGWRRKSQRYRAKS